VSIAQPGYRPTGGHSFPLLRDKKSNFIRAIDPSPEGVSLIIANRGMGILPMSYWIVFRMGKMPMPRSSGACLSICWFIAPLPAPGHHLNRR